MDRAKRVSRQVLDELRKISTSTLSDAVDGLGLKGFMTSVYPIIENLKIVGPAVTVRFVRACRKNYRLGGLEHLLKAIDESKPGCVIVLGSEVKDVCLWGELLSTASKVRGIKGVVMDCATRDVSGIRKLRFPVFAGSVNPSTAVGRLRSVGLNEPIECGGAYVNPGDVVVGDDNGVVVVPNDHVSQVLESANKLSRAEKALEEALWKGLSITESLEEFGHI